uniref:hypothetical protein n=1 Tax=Eubacterium cellulosolvens TaxID=29322 RepID=UPI0012DBD8BF|nr:hypothetical protein [[Eubacterium] cellulosolvens]
MKSQKMAQLTVLALLVFAGSLTLGDTQVQANEGSDATHPAKGTEIWSLKKPKMF